MSLTQFADGCYQIGVALGNLGMGITFGILFPIIIIIFIYKMIKYLN